MLCAFGAARGAEVFSHVEFTEGRATIVDAKGQSRPARVGEKVLEGETVVTGSDGELHARTDDHGLIALRPNTRITVQSYRAAGDNEDRSVLSLVGGTLRSITGWIGKYRPGAYAVKTTTATVGIRGTDHEPLVIAPGDKQGAAGTYDKVNAGSTYIENSAGRVDIAAGHAGFAPHDAKAAPRALDKIPEAYRATRNEGRVNARKEELAREMEQHRLQRQKDAKEKAAAAKEKVDEKASAAKEKTEEKADVAKDKAHEKAERRRRAANKT